MKDFYTMTSEEKIGPFEACILDKYIRNRINKCAAIVRLEIG